MTSTIKGKNSNHIHVQIGDYSIYPFLRRVQYIAITLLFFVTFRIFKALESVTDPDYAAELTDFDRLSFGDTFMIVSLGELYEREYQGRTLRDHFKIVAKIFETVYTIPNNRLGYFHAFKDCRYLERYRNSLQRALWQEMEAEGKQPCPTCMGRLDGALE